MRFYYLLLGILCTWRLTHLLQAEAGPWDIFLALRRWLGPGLLGTLLGCFYCLSVWIAAPIAYVIGESPKEFLLLWPALSAGAILLERLTTRNDTYESAAPAQFWEEKEEQNELLWKKQREYPQEEQEGKTKSV